MQRDRRSNHREDPQRRQDRDNNGLHQVIKDTPGFIPEKKRKEAVRKSSQRVFQALRIDVNK